MKAYYGRLAKEVGDVSFFLTDSTGGFLNFSPVNTIYSGMFSYFDDEYKIIESIEVEGFSYGSISNYGGYAELKGEMKQWMWMPFPNSLVCELSEERTVRIFLDVKKAYDNRTWGRNYSCWDENGCAVVEFIKKTDSREDSTNGKEEYRTYVAIKAPADIRNLWVRHEYISNTNEPLQERYVYLPAEFAAKKIAIAAAKTKEEAVQLASVAINTLPHGSKTKEDSESEIAASCAENALNQLIVCERMFAGLPWFFQAWSRDSAVAAKALILTGREELAKKIIFSIIKEILPDGRVPNLSHGLAEDRSKGGAIGSADGVGWAFKRVDDLLPYLSAKERAFAIERLEKAITSLRKAYDRDFLIENKAQETWVDTTGGTHDVRAGLRLEIQALQLAMYSLAYKLTKNRDYKKLELQMRKKVRKVFWNGKILADGRGEWTVRPNLFIAAYVYPQLLTKKDWETCFENALKQLWLPWGGIASISKRNRLFQRNYTGWNDASYHRGDSWFWINNLAAIVMKRVNAKKFSFHIKKIMSASTEEILWKGALGCHAELSSASRLESHGCLTQAWSSAMYLEMVGEIKNFIQ